MRPVVAIDIKTLPWKHIGPFTFSWAQPAGRLIWATLLLAIGVGIVLVMIHRPKPAEPATWAQAMLGAVATASLMLLAYGTIPHEWLNFSNSYLHWNAAKFIVRSGQKIGPIHFLNFDINKQAIADAITAGIYVVMLTLNVYLFAKWQKRPTREAVAAAAAADAPEKVVGESAYGRPVTVKA